MVMDFGQKVIKVSCPNCEWTEQWMVGNNGSSRCYSVAFNEDGTAKETNISSSEKTIFGHDKIPGKCPCCGAKVTKFKLPVCF